MINPHDLPRARQRLRIIGGTWRGRRIDFPAVPGLRPTPDRVRETLFNWLQGSIVGNRCLDLFAGSGALGFEAASRGANSVVMVDTDPRVVQQLRAHAERLGAANIELVMRDAQSYLSLSPSPFDVVFLDPPFGSNLLTPICQVLDDYGALKSGARVCLESAAAAGVPAIPTTWALLKSQKAGQVGYHLAINQR
ncbi:MAG: 16S rRNA (guanine(966)-N(2))-methyltransferase RsmD [Pseudomonadota bacterium]|nr:16S rRNA (guanine(966)-N(2))-methyltransferase RsmD [Pseudomonadota bacterium]